MKEPAMRRTGPSRKAYRAVLAQAILAPGLRCIAFLSPSKGLVVEFLINSTHAAETRIIARGLHVRLQLPPISITTAVWPSPN
jgi:O-glycosyl hydrolase